LRMYIFLLIRFRCSHEPTRISAPLTTIGGRMVAYVYFCLLSQPSSAGKQTIA
jgi:hypothetical protein